MKVYRAKPIHPDCCVCDYKTNGCFYLAEDVERERAEVEKYKAGVEMRIGELEVYYSCWVKWHDEEFARAEAAESKLQSTQYLLAKAEMRVKELEERIRDWNGRLVTWVESDTKNHRR